MSKGDTLPGLKIGNPLQCHLPLVIKRAMARARARLLFAAHVHTKIADLVMPFISVHMVNAFSGCEWTTQMLCHYPAMFQDWLSRMLHGSVHRKVMIGNVTREHISIARTRCPARRFSLNDTPSVRASGDGYQCAWSAQPLKILTHHFASHVSQWTSSTTATTRALNSYHRSRPSKIATKVWGADDGIVMRNWAVVSWTRHNGNTIQWYHYIAITLMVQWAI